MQPDLLPETILLVSKDFNLTDEIPSTTHTQSAEAFRQWLAGLIEHKLETDLEGFLQALYRLDISEPKAMLALSNQTELPAPFALADLIIEREIQKVNTRRLYKEQMKQNTPPEPDDNTLIADTWD